jgi:hypothetical protein
MRPTRLTVLALGAALAGWIGGAAAQQPLTPQQKLEAQQKAQQASKVYYDVYEASRRFPTRSGGCQQDKEQPLGSFCVRLCKAGYVATDDAKAAVRQCRSQKPLPPGQLPTAGRKETSTQPAAKPSASRPGV